LVGGDTVNGHIARIKSVITGGWLQQRIMSLSNHPVADFHSTDGAGCSSKAVGGFKIHGGEVDHLPGAPATCRARCGASARKALPRCEISFLVAESSSAAVLPIPAISIIGS